jgi:hypothetical protein
MLDAFIDAVPECGSFDHGNTLSQILPCIEVLTETQAERLASAFNTNSQLQGSFGFNGAKEWQFGPGLAFHLSRATGKEYLRTESKSFPNTLQIKLKRR